MIPNILKRKEPSEVFTPRSAKVNSVMYINRPDHERALRRAVSTGYNIVIFGDSGCGKSWLYKRTFAEDDTYYRTIDFSSCENIDDVDIQILEIYSLYEEWEETEYKKTKSADFKPGRIGLGGLDETTHERNEKSPFAKLISKIRSYAGKKRAFLVLENLEYVLDKPDIVKKIQGMLLALDDEFIGDFNVQICLVGVPSEIKEILADGNRFQTLSNRVYEIPEVNRLERKSVDILVNRGLIQELGHDIESKTYCYSLIAFVTYQIPQYVHDVCLHIALRAEETPGPITPTVVQIAIQDWINSNCRQGMEFLRTIIMKDRSKNSIKSKTIFAISRLDKHFFDADDVNEALRSSFPNTIGSARLQTLSNLRRLADGEQRLLKCDQDRQLFRVSTPHLRSALRICLDFNQDSEEIRIKPMKR